MPKKITEIIAKNFNSRQELEKKVTSLTGLTPDIKDGYIIKGTKKELKKLFLSDKNVFWGIRCEETDSKPASKKKPKKIHRGKVHKSKLETMDIKNSKEHE